MDKRNNTFSCELIPYEDYIGDKNFDYDKIIFDLDSKINTLTSNADSIDYVVSVASGITCALLDILWVGEFSLSKGREIASDKVDGLVKKTAKMLGCKNADNMTSAVKFLEEKFPIPSDGNTSDFGGGLQHHLRDFAHHPTIIGLIFSLLTQFTLKSYGTDVNGRFLVVKVPEKSKIFIGKNIPEKFFMGTITWFFHLVSDIAGSSSTAGRTGGTGIPGPILSLAKELSAIPLFKNIKVGEDTSLSVFLSKLFNGTLLAHRDENGVIIKESALKFDLRSEIGVAIELTKQAVPVIANECIVRAFYFIRRLITEIKKNSISSISDLKNICWNDVKPYNSPTLSRMLTIATGVFTTLDIGEAILTKKYWVSVNYVGVGRFAVAIAEEISWGLKTRDIKAIRSMYENISRQTFKKRDSKIYARIGEDFSVDIDKLGLTLEQTEILYNIEYFKVYNDIKNTSFEWAKELKVQWLEEWKTYISKGFASFIQIEGATIHWCNSAEELYKRISEQNAQGTWYRLVLLEAMLFEPYYPLALEKDKKGKEFPSKKYKKLNAVPFSGYNKEKADKFLNQYFTGKYCEKNYINRLRKCYKSCINELNEVLKGTITSLSVAAVIAIVFVATTGAFAGPIAVALVGSKFAGLSGAALTSACLAYLGGGAIAAGGAGMLGGTMTIVGGGAALGLGVGAGVGGAIGSVSITGKKNTIMQSAKLMTSIREIFLNDEKDIVFSNSVYERYLKNIEEIEKELVELRLKRDIETGDEKKALSDRIKEIEQSVHAMKIARKSMHKFNSSFELGVVTTDKINKSHK